MGFCYMAYLASHRKIVMAIVLTLGAALIALAIAAWRGSAAHAGGDPGGRLMAKITPLVRVVPDLEHGHIPWTGYPCDACRFPVRYAIKVEPRWDSCDGMAGTFGWDPVVIQVGFPWTSSSRTLVGLVDKRLAARGWARGAAPSWSGDETPIAWISSHGHAPTEMFTLDPPIPGSTNVAPSNQWTATIEAKPQGQLVSGC